MNDTTDTVRRVTGRTVLYWLGGFFGVMFIANGIFVWLALTSWSGMDVASPYRASQQFNARYAEGAAQQARGWTVEGSLDRHADGAVALTFVATDGKGSRLAGMDFRAGLRRPTSSAQDRAFDLSELAPGRYTASLADVPPGQWDLVLEAWEGGERVYRSVSRKHLKGS